MSRVTTKVSPLGLEPQWLSIKEYPPTVSGYYWLRIIDENNQDDRPCHVIVDQTRDLSLIKTNTGKVFPTKIADRIWWYTKRIEEPPDVRYKERF